MTAAKFNKICNDACAFIKSMSPYDTGNLRRNAIRIEFENVDTCRIYVDEGIAPYMIFTNEPWEHKVIKMGNFRPGEVVERLRTWDNPNEAWWNKAVEAALQLIAKKAGGILK